MRHKKIIKNEKSFFEDFIDRIFYILTRKTIVLYFITWCVGFFIIAFFQSEILKLFTALCIILISVKIFSDDIEKEEKAKP